MNTDYFKVLGLTPDADMTEIEKAYRQLAKKYHPDLNPDPQAAIKYQQINEAYEALHNNDQIIFNNAFVNEQTDPTMPQKGHDINYELTLSFMEAIKGKKVEIAYERHKSCIACHGKGYKDNEKPDVCTKCHGTGQIITNNQHNKCPVCHGHGIIIKHPCLACDGKGKIYERKQLEVNVPAGIDNQQQLRFQNLGEAGKNGGENGDLFIDCHVLPSAKFKRKRQNIYSILPISFIQAALGDQVIVPTVYGNVRMTIPSGTQPNQRFILRGQGIPYLQEKHKGDQIVTIRVVIPRQLNLQQKQDLISFAKHSSLNKRDLN